MTLAPTRQNAVPVPLLDHVMVLVDEQTHSDIVASDFLRERFCRIKAKSVQSTFAGQYSTLGLAGINTLLELFAATVPGQSGLTGGLAFSFEHRGSVEVARRALESAGIGSHHELVHRIVPDGDERQPWYHLLSADLGAGSPLLLFLNEVTPEYFTSIGARPGPGGELWRSNYLDAVLGPVPAAGQWLQDIVEVVVRTRPERATRIAGALGALGYHAEEGPDGLRVGGPAVTVTLLTDDSAPEGVAEVVGRLAHVPDERQELRFGDTSRLLLQPDGVARWSFAPAR
jgi:Family of unknown function (DUF5829)